MDKTMKTPPVVSADAWGAAWQEMLAHEKALTRARDALAARRRRMPWMAVDKAYAFEGPQGKVTLLDLFEGRRQLILYRAFFEPGVFGWPEHACRGCSMVADQVPHLSHLNARDTTLAYISRAPQADISRIKGRMGWDMPWYTIVDNFDHDFGVGEWHGHNVFVRDGDKIFRTYLINSRGDEAIGTIWSYLDMTPLGRQETWEDSPKGYPQTPTIQMVELERQLRGRDHAEPDMGRGVRRRRGQLPEVGSSASGCRRRQPPRQDFGPGLRRAAGAACRHHRTGVDRLATRRARDLRCKSASARRVLMQHRAALFRGRPAVTPRGQRQQCRNEIASRFSQPVFVAQRTALIGLARDHAVRGQRLEPACQ